MSKIEIGEFVRTKKGYIVKVKNIVCKDYPLEELQNGIIGNDEDNTLILPKEVVKHSKNQKELIQEGDILEYQINKLSFTKIGEVKKYKDARSFKEYLGVEGFNLEQITILKILTKEKFEEESYKVGD